MPCYNIERGVVLSALEELAAKLVNDFPRFMLNFILCNGVKEISRIRQSIRTQRAQFWEFKVRPPDFYVDGLVKVSF